MQLTLWLGAHPLDLSVVPQAQKMKVGDEQAASSIFTAEYKALIEALSSVVRKG